MAAAFRKQKMQLPLPKEGSSSNRIFFYQTIFLDYLGNSVIIIAQLFFLRGC